MFNRAIVSAARTKCVAVEDVKIVRSTRLCSIVVDRDSLSRFALLIRCKDQIGLKKSDDGTRGVITA